MFEHIQVLFTIPKFKFSKTLHINIHSLNLSAYSANIFYYFPEISPETRELIFNWKNYQFEEPTQNWNRKLFCLLAYTEIG